MSEVVTTATENERDDTETDTSLINIELKVSPTIGRPPLDVTIYVSAHNEGDTESSLDVVIDRHVVHTLVVPGGESVDYELTRTFSYEGAYHIRFGEERETVMVSGHIADLRQTQLTFGVASLLLMTIVILFSVYLVRKEEKNHYGDEKKLYYGITLVGLALIIAGAVIYAGYLFLALSEPYQIIGIVCMVIGVFTIVPGLLGYHEEKRLEGKKKISVKSGRYSVVIGIIGVFLLKTPLIPIILGVIAIILGKKAMDEGDNQYGLGGVILGCANIVISLLLTFMFL